MHEAAAMIDALTTGCAHDRIPWLTLTLTKTAHQLQAGIGAPDRSFAVVQARLSWGPQILVVLTQA
jgi:hypothetical protein